LDVRCIHIVDNLVVDYLLEKKERFFEGEN